MRRNQLLLLCACLILPVWANPAAAQSFPNRQIRLVIPFPPGGGTDIAARLIGEKLGIGLKQTVVPDNKPGANGIIASELVARAAPDGYTLLVATGSSHAFAPALGVKLPFDPVKDFIPVALIGQFPTVLVINPAVPAKTMREFVDYARQNPKKLNYGSAGNGSTNHFLGELVKQTAGIDMLHVPYKGSGPASADLLAGQIQAMVDSVAAAKGNIDAGKLRALGVTTAQRVAQLPDVPTLKESGFDIEYAGWVVVMAPAGTPAEVVTTLHDAIAAAMTDPAVVERYGKQGIVIKPMSLAELPVYLRNDKERWAKVAAQAGLKGE
ncbi:MAG TPA: tripartite tricarboxylate transporter substrate binding protein [Burkholderiaceae bacterium]|nr:tripartite tricarboxylate transporter substrate binding protein [Rhodoferax sp.]HQZ06126.1 tripartite tricarboxylate transporter substrate binding protein [Burkholderiaceae bacterium]